MKAALKSSVAALALMGAAFAVPATAQDTSGQTGTEIQTEGEAGETGAEAGAETETDTAQDTGEEAGDMPADGEDAAQAEGEEGGMSAEEGAEQPAEDGMAAEEGTEQPAEDGMAAEEGAETAPEDTAPEDQAGAEMADGAAGGELFLAQQQENELIISDYMGESVINGAGETLGDINDVLVSEDGGVRGLVIGVGGFLGIGEKSVAVSFDAVDVQQNPETEEREIVLDTTAEELEAAPEFQTLEEMEAAQASDGMNQTAPEGTTTGGMGTDGSATMAPEDGAAEGEQPTTAN